MDEPGSVDLSPLTLIFEKNRSLGRSGLLPTLQAAQKIYGWFPKQVLSSIATELKIPLADVHGVVEFYGLLYNNSVGKTIYRVCMDPACGLKGCDDLLEKLKSQTPTQKADGSEEISVSVETSTCLGLCDHAPAMMINDGVVTDINSNQNSFNPILPASLIFGTLRLLTKNCGNGRPTPLKDYGYYQSLNLARKKTPEDLIAEIKFSGLVGRGGAAFPTGIKWEGARSASGKDKFIVCNADESEPGTFKDRVLLSDDPHKIIEGMCIAAYAVGATHGYIYLRGEYPYLLPILEYALIEARNAGYLGKDFDIEIRLGAGAYICGEETALFESIEGKRGFPRIKPPFPTTNGLFGAPTVINNVETLANVPVIIEKGAIEYRKIGTGKSPGPKLFCLSGDVAKPGVYEVPFGTTLRELLEMAGNIPSPNKLQVVLLGGAAGAFATQKHLDVKLTFEDLRSANLPLGSGVVMVFNDSCDIRDILRRLGRFFAHESCGKCYPCQMGTQRQKEILDRLALGHSLAGDVQRLQDVGWTMADSSLCGLGQTAASAVLSAIQLFPDLFSS